MDDGKKQQHTNGRTDEATNGRETPISRHDEAGKKIRLKYYVCFSFQLGKNGMVIHHNSSYSSIEHSQLCSYYLSRLNWRADYYRGQCFAPSI